MEDAQMHDKVYSKNTVEFVTVAAEYVILAENAARHSRSELVDKLQKILPLLYLKASVLPRLDVQVEENIEKFVSEEDWLAVQQGFSGVLGRFDRFLDISNPIDQVMDETAEEALSECLADIYQDLSDFVQLYRMGNLEIMNDALWECKQNFEQYWGSRLVAALQEIHFVLFGAEDLAAEDDQPRPVYDPEHPKDKQDWMESDEIRQIKNYTKK